MAGQVLVTIGSKEWYVDVATLPWELSQGLGGVVEIPVGTGMLFDLGIEQTIEVTTVPMLFPLDIAFLSKDMTITEVYRNVEPGYIVTSQLPARYFLEANAGELADVEAGMPISLEYLATEVVAPAESGLISAVVPFVGFLAAGTITTLVMRDVLKGLFDDEKSYLLQQANNASAECEIVRPQHYDILSWVGAPLPDYSFTIEPEVKERKIDEVL